MKINFSRIIEIKNLTVSYNSNKIPILRNLHLDMKRGENLAIIGESGCGKSTFAKSLINMLPEGSICEGDLFIDGKDLRNMTKEELEIFRRTKFGYIYQDSIKKLNPLMSVGAHLYELLKIHWRYKSNIFIEKSVKEIFNKVRIDTSRLNSYPHEFSGGMRQRVCIALALALNPLILIADEPTTSLDSLTSYEIMKELVDLCKNFGSTLILISHDIGLAAKWCKEVAIIENGMIIERGSITEIFNSPKSAIGKKLVNSSVSSVEPNLNDNKLNEIILEAENLRYWYRLNSSIINPKWNRALNEVTFKLKINETIGVVGLSGSGKSTLGKALVGLLELRGGNIKYYINNNKFKSIKNQKINSLNIIQMIFQDPFSSLNPKMTIIDTLEDIGRMNDFYKPKNFRKEIYSIFNKLHLPINNNFLNSYPSQLSGGQLQRISIARAILLKPKILICDESLNMLDAPVKIEILQLLRKIQNEMQISIIFITHELGLAKKFCDRILIINKGKIIEEGYSQNIFKDPKHSITKNLIHSSLDI
tara:strand:- start:9091 stop:10692 length:1602 start_codon:yes stop_codon:yes gene_type:complete